MDGELGGGCGGGVLTDWMLAGIGREYLLEIRTADGQDDFVSLQQFAITCQRNIHEISAVVEVLKSAGDVVLEVLPAKLKLIVHCDDERASKQVFLFLVIVSSFWFFFLPRLI